MFEPHLHLCNRAVFRDTATESGNLGHNRDIRQNSRTVPAIPGRLAATDFTGTKELKCENHTIAQAFFRCQAFEFCIMQAIEGINFCGLAQSHENVYKL